MKPKTRARLNRSKSPEITQTKLGLPSIDPPLGALPIGLGTPSPQIALGGMRLLVNDPLFRELNLYFDLDEAASKVFEPPS
jgi:hypothetical protein